MEGQKFRVLHICDYAATYRGNFIDSLESLETDRDDVKNYYLFPARAVGTPAESWITQLNQEEQVAYIQDKHFLKTVRMLAKLIREKKIDRIVRHFSDLRIDLALKFLFDSKKVVRFFHCRYIPQGSRLRHWLRKLAWKNNKLVGVSHAVAQELKMLLPGFSVTAIPNAIHFQRLDLLEDFTPSAGIRLLIMGRDYEIKGTDLAIQAVQRLQEKYPITLQIIGGKKEAKLKKLILDTLGHEPDWIRYLPPTNRIGTYYKANDIFLSPSRQEAFGYASVEAAYWKNSVVLSKVDGQAEIRLDGAYWFPPEDVDAFTQQLEKAILERNTPEKIRQLEQVKLQVEQIYSLKEWGNQLVALF